MDDSSPPATPQSQDALSEMSLEKSPATSGPSAAPRAPDAGSTTHLLAYNSHWTSSVRRIDEILQGLSLDVLGVSVSILSHEIHVLHLSSVTPEAICAALADEAYEVSAATTVDRQDRLVFERAFPAASAGWWDSFARSHPPRPGQGSPSCLPVPTRSKRQHHEENCVACQTQAAGAASEKSIAISPKARLEKVAVCHESPVPPAGKQIAARTSHRAPEISISGVRPDGKVQQKPASPPKESFEPPRTTANLGREYSVSLSVGGMTCASCVNAIATAAKSLDYVRDAKVDLMNNNAVVYFSGDRNLAQRIKEAVEDIGYEASIVLIDAVSPDESEIARKTSSDVYEASLAIGGMTCASCVNAVTDGLKALGFVEDVRVALITNSAIVRFRDKANASNLVEAVEDLGYDGTLESCEAVAPLVAQHEESDLKPRQIQIKVDGMYCEHCAPRVLEMLKER